MAGARKLPMESFEMYISMGIDRSYQAIADHYKVTKVAVTNRARRDKWQDRLAAMEDQVRREFEEAARSEMKAVRDRQLQAARALQGKALEVLRDLPPERAIKAGPSLKIGWAHELLLLGEPTVRNASVEEITRNEVRELLTESDDDWEDSSAK